MGPSTHRWVTVALVLVAACSDDDKLGTTDASDVAATAREQCQPCRADPGCPQGARCLDYLGLGAFCGDECSDTQACPSGFLCTRVDTLAGQTVNACVHDSGMCPCTPEVAAKAEPTVCVTPSDWGSCRGESTCDGRVWSACDGPIAMPDLPNGLDDDCDGQTDENICSCGDGLCNGACGENVTTCPCDCSVVGDGICSPCGESPETAPGDCCRSPSGSSSCGDHVCMGYGCGETPATCATDCGNACGNLICEQGESPYSCREDCLHKVCGNHICESTDGGPEQCPQDCAPFCGNCICEPERDESQFNCPIDCGYCGDRECSRCSALKENAESCAEDCCEPGATCLVAGSCNVGRYTCEDSDECELTSERWPRGVECGPKTCEGNQLRLESRCDDDGACQPGLLFPCSGYVCRNDACVESCAGPSDCAPGFTCLGTVCAPLTNQPTCEETCTGPCVRCDVPGHVGVCWPTTTPPGCEDPGDPPGTDCESDDSCATGHCEQGVCCTTACTGLCRSCDLGGHEGTCTNVPRGDDPGEHCQQDVGDVCGETGACDGAGHCDVAPATTTCGGGVCNDDIFQAVQRCNGAGACVTTTPLPCPGHLGCKPDNTTCLTRCEDDDDCVDDYICDLDAHTCEAPRPDGAGCTNDAQCANGHCEDMICCDDVCESECMSCRLANHLGTCWLVPAGEDPEDDCDPVDGMVCGPIGTCDGGGRCADAPNNTPCAAPGCFEGEVATAFHCDGDGACVGQDPIACPNHLECRDASACLTRCMSSDDCSDGWVCNVAKGECVDPGRTGSPCDSNDDCTSAHCEHDVCCAENCTGPCRRCGLDGACEAIDQQAVAGCQDAMWCVLGQCQARGLPDGTPCQQDGQCASTHCSDDVCCSTDCDGLLCKDCSLFGHAGTCTPVVGEEDDCTNSPLSSPCTEGNCTRVCDDLGQCGNETSQVALCFDDASCLPDQWCLSPGTTCQRDFARGTMCMRNAQCVSNKCTFFVCE